MTLADPMDSFPGWFSVLVTREFELPNGRQLLRGSMEDLPTFNQRVFGRILEVMGEEKSNATVIPGANAYNQGLYEDALEHFSKAMNIAPDVREELYPHWIVCRRVMDEIRLHKDNLDGHYDESVDRWKHSFLQRFRKPPSRQVHCKYCGHYTDFIHPNDGWGWSGNQCRRCGRQYPMPDFLWDSIDGQGYIYYRGSVSEPEFYRDFEAAFDVEEPYNWREGRTHEFSGTAFLDDDTPPDGTIVAAWVAGNEVAYTFADTDGWYNLMVNGGEHSLPPLRGSTVTFTIGDYTAEQSVSWRHGSFDKLDLDAYSATNGSQDFAYY